MIIENDLIRISVEEKQKFTREKIEIKEKDRLISILASEEGYSTLNFWRKNKRETKALSFLKSKKKKLYYQLNDDDFLLNLDYCLEERNIIHVKYKLSNKRELNLSKILANYEILLGNNPDFTWVPHLCPGKNYVIGDHVFRSPVVIYKKGKYGFAFIPDLKTLGSNRPFSSFINFNLEPNNNEKWPQISFGFGNYKPTQHILFIHEPQKEWMVEENTDLTFRFYIIIFFNKTNNYILKFINNFLWEKYGRKVLHNNLNPQIFPFEMNVQEGYTALFDQHKFWGDFKINNVECGGIWFRSWSGKKKKPIEFIKPENLEEFLKRSTSTMPSLQSKANDMINELTYNAEKVEWFDNYTRRRAYIPRTAEIWNNAFFLNIRTGYGLRYFGELWNNKDLIDKGTKILNTILQLPRRKGVFPSVILPASPDSNVISIINGLKAFSYTDDFHIVDSCLAMYWALKYYQEFEKNEEIIEKCKQLLNLIEIIQMNNGVIPSYINFKEDKTIPIFRDILINSASSGASLLFLTELYKILKEERILEIIKRIAGFIKTEIVPTNKWHDFEPFFSCSQYPLDTFDNYTNSHIINTLCVYWCTEGFKELYKVTNNSEHLKTGEYVLAILSLFQQVWDMPYISINTFGGFGVQNADAELNDARQALFIHTYMDYYLLTGKNEYMERGIAALRASWVLQLLPEYEILSPGNVQGIDTIEGVDKGVVYENYGHSGSDFRTPGHIAFDWGVGTAATATAYVKKHFGDLFIDFNQKKIWGIDGLLIKNYEFLQDKITIDFDKIPKKDSILFKARDAPSDQIEIIINNNSIGLFDKGKLEKGFRKEFK
ncbi:MAG: hypothetical protein ACFE88_10790 [Candidatus Hermodarchaeota archaeon]